MQSCPTQVNRLKPDLEAILEKYKDQLVEDAPFIIELTDRMLADIEAARRNTRRLRRHAAWPSLN